MKTENTNLSDNSLPAPRLELRWKKESDNWYNKICEYVLVLPLGKYDIRRETKDGIQSEYRVVIGTTKSRGGNGNPPVYDGIVETPFRDGSHAIWDSHVLGGLPIYACCEDISTKLDTNNLN